ncbi:MAG: UDP-N-acetylglucosamine 2-epimerase (non-hydrolyzing) [Gammaproteobacteria bacterium]|nr:UDP-N-acetylglucosamine 2-epimerase (non-hydrolyzing) [Gammaproteobacteria bacterium]
MKQKKRILIVFGTRPETIKFAPVIQALKAKTDEFETAIAVTGQHREMLHQALAIFAIKPDFDLDIMRANQDLFDVSIHALQGLKEVMKEFNPDCVLVQGDTTSTFIGALAAFYMKAKVGHIEAGLRTFNRWNPFPEEGNRKLTSCVTDLHFAPTAQSRQNLLGEGYSEADIFITGNTSIDALLWVLENTQPEFEKVLTAEQCEVIEGRFILLTTHRRENFGKPMEDSLLAVCDIVERHPDVKVVMPVHFNPNVRSKVDQILRGNKNIILIEPLDYLNFAHLMGKAELILTDSGGVQEEAPTLGKPILVLRETTERPEGIESGTAKLVGSDRELIVAEASRLLSDKAAYEAMANKANPYGDGKAAQRIVDAMSTHL